MQRREALYHLGIITGAAFLAGSSLVSCGSKRVVSDQLTEDDAKLLNEIGEIIIPATAGSPGAKAANTGKYIQVIVNDCFSEHDRTEFLDGWRQMQTLGKEAYDKGISSLSDKEINAYLTDLDKYSAAPKHNENWDLAIVAFQKIKHLTVEGYFTSEVGSKQALRYDPVPGKFVGVIAYNPGDKVWARSM